jgi:hypothetical protein
MENNDPAKKIVDAEVEHKYGDLPVVVKDFVVIAEVVTDDGISLLVSTSPSTTPWNTLGLIEYAHKFFDEQLDNSDFNPGEACE